MTFREALEKRAGINLDLTKDTHAALTPDYTGFRQMVWGQAQPVNYNVLWKAFLEVPEVYACILTITDAVMGSGYVLEGPKLHKKRLADLLDKNNWNQKLRDTIMQLLIYGDAYLELVRGVDVAEVRQSIELGNLKKATGLMDVYRRPRFEHYTKSEDNEEFDYGVDNRGNVYRTEAEFMKAFGEESKKTSGYVTEFYPVDSSTTRIDYDEHGTVIKYIQRVRQRRVDYYPDEIIHFKINVVGDRQYGQSPLFSLLYTLQTKQLAELYTSEYFRRSGQPRTIYHIGKNSMFSKEQVERLKMELRSLHPQEDIVLSGDVEGELLAPSNADMQFKELLSYLQQQIFMAFQVPPVLLGKSETSNRSLGTVNMDMFVRNVNTKRAEIEAIMNQQLFTVENFGFDDVVFKFDEGTTRDALKDAQRAQLLSTLVSSQIIMPQEIRVNVLNLPPEPEEGSFVQFGEQEQPFNPTGFANQNPNMANPMRNEQRVANAHAHNVDQQMDSKQRVSKSQKQKWERYPYGAVKPEPSTDDPRSFVQRMKEVLSIVENPIENSENINHVRQWPKAKMPKTRYGKEAKGLNTRKALKENKSDKAVFYEGTDQLSEDGLNAEA